MSDTDLTEYLPLYGDRQAVKHFCQQELGESTISKRKNILKKLRARIHSKRHQFGSNSDGEEETRKKNSKCSGNRNAFKGRRVELGWLNFDQKTDSYKQVRARTGGGTRQLNIEKSTTVMELLKTAKELFFPGGKSARGYLEAYNTSLRDFQEEPLDLTSTVRTLCERSKMRLPRFYLCTKPRQTFSIRSDIDIGDTHIIDISTDTEDQPHLEGSYSDDISTKDAGITEPINKGFLESEINTSHENLAHVDEALPDIWTENDIFPQPTDSGDTWSDSFVSSHISQDSEVQFGPILSARERRGSTDTLTSTTQTVVETEQVTIRVHRGSCLMDLISYFKDPGVMSPDVTVMVTIVSQNGKDEAGSGDAEFRDCLTEFWHDFYEQCCTGNQIKVPVVRHDFQLEEWSAVARIIYKGWQCGKYFPIFLSPIVVEEAMFGKHLSNLIRTFLHFIPSDDKATLETAMHNFGSVDKDKILEFFDSHKCRRNVTEENLAHILHDIAHKELIQEPKYIIDCWSYILHDLAREMSPDELRKLYTYLRPTSKKV